MAIEYKMLTEKELNTFINMRINQLREEGAKEEIDLVPALKDYYTRHMADGTFVSFHQDTNLHIQVLHQWQVRLMHSQIRE